MRNAVARDAFRFCLYTGMRRAELLGLEWARVLRIADTLTRRHAERERFSEARRTCGFPSANPKAKAGHIDSCST